MRGQRPYTPKSTIDMYPQLYELHIMCTKRDPMFRPSSAEVEALLIKILEGLDEQQMDAIESEKYPIPEAATQTTTLPLHRTRMATAKFIAKKRLFMATKRNSTNLSASLPSEHSLRNNHPSYDEPLRDSSPPSNGSSPKKSTGRSTSPPTPSTPPSTPRFHQEIAKQHKSATAPTRLQSKRSSCVGVESVNNYVFPKRASSDSALTAGDGYIADGE